MPRTHRPRPYVGSSGTQVARTMLSIAAALALTIATCGPTSAAALRSTGWIGTWSVAVQPQPTYNGEPLVTLNGQTIREVIRISAGATRFRLRLSNEHTSAPTRIGEVHVAISRADGHASGAIEGGTDRAVTFAGGSKVTLAPFAPVLSDWFDLPAGPLASLAVSIYVEHGGSPTTFHESGLQRAYIASGDHVAAPDMSAGSRTTHARYLLAGVDAYQTTASAAVVTFGDSIMDGYESTPDANHRWPDFLAQRLQNSGKHNIAVLNEGLSGNRILLDGTGPNAVSRFARDVLAQAGAHYVIVSLGINDIRYSGEHGMAPATAQDLVFAFEQFVTRAHELGMRVYVGTLTPYWGSALAKASGEAIRENFNTLLRTHTAADGLIDFDRVTRDPSNPQRLLPAYDSGDHLHLSDAGNAAVAQAVDLSMFQ